MPASSSFPNKARRRRAVSVAVVVLIAMIASNWVYSIQLVLAAPQSVGVVGDALKVTSIDNLLSSSAGDYWTGGWPFKYYVHVEHKGLPPFTTLSFYHLLLNGLFWAGIASLMWGYLWLSNRATSDEAAAEKPRTGQVGLLDLFVVMLVLALCFGYWRLMMARLSDEKVVAKLVASFEGSTEESVVVPKFIANIVPSMYHPFFNRIVGVTLESPTDEVLNRVLALPELRRLRIGGGSYDLKRLGELRKMPYLSELRVSGRELDSSAVAAIGSCKQMVSLNLLRTNISTEGMAAMSDLPRLEKLSLIHTPVDISKLGEPSWKRTLTELALPHPGIATPANPELGVDVCAKIVLRDWPALQILTCNEYDQLENKTCVVLDVGNCPQLNEIRLDQLQRFDLFLNNLPALSRISTLDSQWKTRIRKTEPIGVAAWVRKFVQSGTPKLNNLNLFGRDLEELSLDTTTLPYLGISSEYRTSTRKEFNQVNGYSIEADRAQIYLDDIPVEQRQTWIDELGKANGPNRVDLSYLELHGVDLSPLKNNSGILDLDLSWTTVSARQLGKLEGSSIQKLVLNGSDIDGPNVCRLLAKLPALRELRIVSEKIQELDLESLDKLETIFLEAGPRELTNLRLVSMPNLRESFDVRWPLRKCELVDVPSLQGLSFQFSLPTATTISGIRDLRFFAAGGSSISDELMNEVLNCKQLRSLTLAYATQVSNATLAKIAELPELQYVALPGCNVNDETIRILSRCQKLTELVLDDTAVTDSSFEGFDLSKLTRFSVNYTKVTEATVAKVISNPAFTSLGLAGMQLSVDTVERIAKGKVLAELDLSETQLNADSWNAMAEHLTEKNLRLILRDAKIDVKQVQELLSTRTYLVLDVTGSAGLDGQDGNDALVQFLLSTNRYSATDRIIDSWQLGNESVQPARPMVNSRLGTNNMDSKFERPLVQGMIRHFPFSPRWKALQKRKAL